MSRALNTFLQQFDDSVMTKSALLLSLVFTVLGTVHGGTVFAWLMLVGFAAGLAALAGAITQFDEKPMPWFAAGAFALGIKTSLDPRFPGLHLNWLWVLLGVTAVAYFLSGHGNTNNRRYYSYLRKPLPERFTYVLKWALVMLTAGLAVIYHDTGIIIYIAVADALLLLLWASLRQFASYAPVRA